jgi:tetratricopeptide (TPR) repeat protein
MPAAPFMDIDWRRDHSLRIPRPQLSVDLQTPNACSQCHIGDVPVPEDRKDKLPHYWAWMRAAEAGDTEARRQLDQLDRWAVEWCEKWYGRRSDTDHHFAHALAQAWKGDRSSAPQLVELSGHRRLPGIVRASTLFQLAQLDPAQAAQVSLKLLSDRDPQVRAVAVSNTRPLDRKPLIDHVVPMLKDPVRWVRLEAARVLAALPDIALTTPQRAWREAAEKELLAVAQYDADQAASHFGLGVYYQDRGRLQEAIDRYRAAIAVQPDVTGPRTNLALLLEDLGQTETAQALARDELRLIERDVQFAPESAPVRYRYGLALFRDGELPRAIEQLEECVSLQPLTDHYWFTLAMLYERAGRWQDGRKAVRRAVEIDPQNEQYQILEQRIGQGGGN